MTNEILNPTLEAQTPATDAAVNTHTMTATYHYKRMDKTPENLAKLTAGYEIKEATTESPAVVLAKDCKYDEEVTKSDDGKVILSTKIKRESETYELPAPTVESLGLVVDQGDVDSVKQAQYLQSIVEDAIYKLGRPLVDAGVALTPENCNWKLAVEAGLATRSAGTSAKKSGISKELLAAAAESFREYLIAIEKPAAGVEAMVKMVKARFSANTVSKYLKGLPLVKDNLVNWIADGCTEEEQEVFGVVAVDMCNRIDEALKPKEDTTELF